MSDPSLSTYQIISILMQYPEEEFFELLPYIREITSEIPHEKTRTNLEKFLSILEESTIDSLIEHYILHFDFGRLTNLYVTYLKLGEQRERGLELLKLKKFYEASGFQTVDMELPDYLPLMLEFCGNVPTEISNELLQMHAEAICEIALKLKESNSYYSHLFDALLYEMERNNIQLNEKVVNS